VRSSEVNRACGDARHARGTSHAESERIFATIRGVGAQEMGSAVSKGALRRTSSRHVAAGLLLQAAAPSHIAFRPSSSSAHTALLQTARLSRHGATMQVTLGPVHGGGSICAGKIRQRHEPHMLSTVLHEVSALHERSGAAGVAGSARIGSGGFAADPPSSDGAFAPDEPEGGVEGAPTCVIPADGDRASEVAASRPSDSGSAGTAAAGARPPGSLES
jgi:hypothetical protein